MFRIRRRRHRRKICCVIVTIVIFVALFDVSVDSSHWGFHVKLRHHHITDTPPTEQPTKFKMSKSRSRWRKEIDQRQRRLQSKCFAEADSNFSPLNLHHFQYNHKHRMFYCAVEKSGSTFWHRLIQQIEKGAIISPYNIRPENGLINRNLANDTHEDIEEILKFSVKFMFVREPYTRLFSGYVDKIFSPNVYFWNKIGEHIVRTVRPNATMSSKTCGHDVTFTEFLKYVIDAQTTGEKKDSHFIPAVELCHPCKVKMDIIGKMETFKADTRYILETFNLRAYLSVMEGPTFNLLNDTIYDVAQAFVAMRTDIRRCMDTYEALLKLWTKLQINGIVSLDNPCPIKRDEVSDLTVHTLTTVIRSAHDQASQGVLQSQRQLLLERAYGQVPQDVLRQIGQIFQKDFDYFGYEQFPYNLFKRTYK